MDQSHDNSLDAWTRSHVSDRDRADGMHELVLLKGEQRYVFTCLPGEESALLEQLRAMGHDSESNLTWMDVALLSHQLGIHLRARIQSLDK